VEFFNGPTALGPGTLVPGSASSYTLVLPANTFLRGSYNISMTATDSNGASASTALVTIQVSDYYNGRLPTLISLGESGPQGLVSVLVTDSFGDLLVNAPLTLAVTTGASQISATPGGTGATTILVQTNSDGLAQVYANFISPASDVLTATAQSGTLITSISIAINPPPSSYIYTTDFEASEGYNLGSLDQQLGWSVTQGAATITSQDAFAGSQSVVLAAGTTPAQIAHTFAAISGESIVYVDFYTKPSAETDVTKSTVFDVGGARFAFQFDGNTNGYPIGILEPFNGDGQGGGQWIQENANFTLDPTFNWNHRSLEWIRLTVRLDYTHQTWDLYANGEMIAADLGLQDATSTQLSTFAVTGDVNAATELDALSVGTTNPLFADVNNDGIDDAWEQQYNLSLSANDRDLMAANGQTVLQDYINGIDPTDYYGGQLPTLTVTNQGGQINADGSVSVRVTNAAGALLANAPVTFSVAQGGSSIALTPGGTTLYSSVTVQSGANGIATVYLPGLQSPTAGTVAVNIGATSGANTEQQALAVSPIPPAPVATVMAEVIDQRVNEYGVSPLIDTSSGGLHPEVYAKYTFQDNINYNDGISGPGELSQVAIDPQTGRDTTVIGYDNIPSFLLNPNFYFTKNTYSFMLSPAEAESTTYFYDYGDPVSIFFLVGNYTYSNPYPSDYLTTQMSSRVFDFTGNFVPTAQSALLDYEPPATGPGAPNPPHYELAKMHYKLQVPQAVQQANDGTTLTWFEVFTPTGATTPTRYLPMSCALAAGQTVAPATGFYTLDPSDATHLNPNVPSTDPSQNGTWQVVPANITIQSYLNTGGSTWLGNAQPVCVGEPIKLNLQIDWPASMTNPPTPTYQWTLPQWTVTLPDGTTTTVGAIKGYNPYAANSPVNAFQENDTALTAQTVTFYMPVVPPANNNTVSCQIKSINGVSLTTPPTITGTLDVEAPPLNSANTTSTVTATQTGPVSLTGPNADGFWTLSDGNLQEIGNSGNFSGAVGIDFDGLIVPSANFQFIGSTCFAQVLNNRVTSYNGIPQPTLTNELDNHFPYGEVAATDNYPADTGIAADGTERRDTDSPQCGVQNPPNNEVQDSFQASMYYMWKPNISGAIWVPLEKFTWGYYAEATAQGSSNVFSLTTNTTPYDPANPPQGHPILSVPPRPLQPVPVTVSPAPLAGEPTWVGVYTNPGGP
jgi:hypothetical protein